MAKYSIILPVRNGGHYIKECVQSILAQTFTDFNFIVLDNCSTDGTLEWLQSLQEDRIQVIPSERPLTIEESWGRIKDIKKNEFITLIGHDDILYPGFLQTIDALVLQYPAAGLYHTHFHFIDATGKITRACKRMKSGYTGSEFLQGFLTSAIDSMGTGYVMRSTDYDSIGGIPLNYPSLLFADFELWTSLAVKGGVVVAPSCCFAFRVHQSTTQTSQDHTLHKALHVFVNHLATIQQEDPALGAIIHEYGSSFLLHYCTAYAHRLLRVPLDKRNGKRVADLVEETRLMAEKLGVAASYLPEKKSSLQIAWRIDNSNLLRFLFLQFKKIYSKPVL